MTKLFSVFLLMLPITIEAQGLSPWEFGGSVLFSSYEGDLHDPNINYSLKNIKPSASIYARRTLGQYCAARISLLFGQIAGADESFSEPAWRKVRGASFESTVVEGSAIAEIYPLSFFAPEHSPSNEDAVVGRLSGKRARFLPYIAIGFGGAYSNPIVDWNDANGNPEIDPALAQKDKEAKTERLHFVLPFGAGLRYRLSDHFSIHLEGLLRPTFSDYLDGFSQAGNPNKKDWFFTAGIGIGYALTGNNVAFNFPTVD
jgi:hypothetical protein